MRNHTRDALPGRPAVRADKVGHQLERAADSVDYHHLLEVPVDNGKFVSVAAGLIEQSMFECSNMLRPNSIGGLAVSSGNLSAPFVVSN